MTLTQEEDLQLERAEFDQPEERQGCAVCSKTLERRYFQVNGQSVCTICCGRLRASFEGGSGLRRGVKAVLFGLGAMGLGTLLYWAILAMTGYEFALIAIVVGLLVGKAVSLGAEGRGGWRYQTLAMALTYLSIVGAYVPLLIAEVRKQPAGIEQGSSTPLAAGEDGQGTPEPVATATPVAVVSDGTAEADASPLEPQQVSLGQALVALAMLIAFICAAPFLAGFENIIGIVIIGIGLYEAWKLNRRRELVITGPHAIAPPVAAAVPAQ
jgi:hypothetical protein